jgi:hypothetical protein
VTSRHHSATSPSARPRRRWRQALAWTAVVAVLATACGGNDDAGDLAATSDEATSGADLDRDAPDVEVAEDAGEVAGGGPDAGGEPDTTAVPAALGRDRIRTAWITLELDDPEAAVDEVAAVAETRGGYLALADLLRDEASGELGGTVTLRVPSDELLPTLDALEALAESAPERRIEEEDVGAELTDLRARVVNLTAYEEELRTLLTDVRGATSDPDDLLPVVERLQSVRSDIDRLRAQRDALEERVALSTVTVTLRPTRDGGPIATATWAPLRTLQEAWAATGRALAVVADAAIWIAVTALPVALVLAGPPLLVWRALRRGQRHAGPPPAGPSASAAPTA